MIKVEIDTVMCSDEDMNKVAKQVKLLGTVFKEDVKLTFTNVRISVPYQMDIADLDKGLLEGSVDERFEVDDEG